MQKIISLFARNYDGDHLVRDEIVPGAEWVVAGEGVATEKIDGTACLIEKGVLFKRYDAKKGRTPPPGFVPAQPEPDDVTGHWPGWLAVQTTDPADKWLLEAFSENGNLGNGWFDGTYEAIGPKIQGNHYGIDLHCLVKHGNSVLLNFPRTFNAIREALAAMDQAGLERTRPIEGIVWHHPDGRMAKIKRRDFNLPWPVKR